MSTLFGTAAATSAAAWAARQRPDVAVDEHGLVVHGDDAVEVPVGLVVEADRHCAAAAGVPLPPAGRINLEHVRLPPIHCRLAAHVATALSPAEGAQLQW